MFSRFFFSLEPFRRHGFPSQVDPSTAHGRTTIRVMPAIRYRPVSVAAGRTQRRAQEQRTRGAFSKRPRGTFVINHNRFLRLISIKFSSRKI